MGYFTCGETQVQRHHPQFTCIICSLPVKTSEFTCFYAASTSHVIQAMTRYKTRKFRVTLSVGCRLTYLQFADEFTRGVITDCLQCRYFCVKLPVFLPAIARVFACVCSYFLLSFGGYFLPAVLVFLPANRMYFCVQKQAILSASRWQICMSSACKTICEITVTFR